MKHITLIALISLMLFSECKKESMQRVHYSFQREAASWNIPKLPFAVKTTWCGKVFIDSLQSLKFDTLALPGQQLTIKVESYPAVNNKPNRFILNITSPNGLTTQTPVGFDSISYSIIVPQGQ
jgi:hypothetical protein